MKKIIFLIIFLGFFLDYSIVSSWGLSFSGASFSLVAVVVAALERNYFEAVFWAAIMGIFLDYVSALPMGTNIFLLVLLVWLIDFFRERLFSEKISFSIAASMFVASFIFYDLVKTIFVKVLVFSSYHGLHSQEYTQGSFGKIIFVKILAIFAGLFFLAFFRKAKRLWGFEKMEIKI